MSDLWYPDAIREPCAANLWGPVFDSLEKHCLHTTEGAHGGDPYIDPWSYGARGNPYHPNYTLHVRDGKWRIAQHIPSNRGARALVTGNGDRITQTEIAWTAHDIRSLPAEAYEVLGALLKWEHDTLGLPLQTAVTFYGDDCGFTLATENARQRLSYGAFDAFRGVLGHQHVPGNDHWDPGGFDVYRLLEAAAGARTPNTTGGGDEMDSRWWPTIAPGDQTHARFVHIACTALADRGWPMPVQTTNDATFQSGIAVVQAWARQADPSITVDGVIGPQTWPAVMGLGPFSKLPLPKDLPSAPSVGSTGAMLPTIRPGDQRYPSFVRIACAALRERGWPMPMRDSNDATFTAGMRVVQAWAGLPPTGVLDGPTWAAVLSLGRYATRQLPKFAAPAA